MPFERAVATQLEQLGYTLNTFQAQQVAELSIERFVTAQGGERSPVSVGVGGSTGSFGSGLGVGVGIDLSGPPPEQIDTQLRVIIRPSAGGTALWEGRARFTATANSEAANTDASATKLASALFASFPGQSGETIQVP